ncbi:MAG TPA: acetate--CoA ligase family protein, partial [Gaiellales bacterium]|nr:acetate--CoA ligase family protein [Gaiellales bacterium]
AGVREAARRMGGRVIVAEQVLGGAELMIGVTRDPDFGATVSVGIGGGLAEALELITHSLAPLDADGARELVASLPVIERLLGAVPDHLIEAIVAVSRLAAEHPEISEIDVNPLLVSPERAVALDCLIVLDTTEERAA